MVSKRRIPKDSPVWEFNYQPDKYIHSSWLSTIPNGALLEKLRKNNSETSQLSKYLLGQLGFDGQFYFDFSDALSLIALWQPEDLERLVKYAGVVYHHDELKRIISRKDVLQLKNTLGDSLYGFALETAPKMTEKRLSSLPYPKSKNLYEKIIISGVVCLQSAFRKHPEALKNRLVIKLPRPWINLSGKYMKHVRKSCFSETECLYVIQQVVHILKTKGKV